MTGQELSVKDNRNRFADSFPPRFLLATINPQPGRPCRLLLSRQGGADQFLVIAGQIPFDQWQSPALQQPQFVILAQLFFPNDFAVARLQTIHLTASAKRVNLSVHDDRCRVALAGVSMQSSKNKCAGEADDG